MSKWENDDEVQRFREYLKIPSVHPDIDYDDCVKFLRKQAEELGLPVVVYEFAPRKPVVVITWQGLEPDLPSILLNSHMDVVPVHEEHWTYPPFAAHVTEDGWIYARGTQDMKSVGMIHLEAVRRLKQAGAKIKRTVHISYVPDEEIGSQEGMKLFAASEEFKRLNIGFELDESGPHHKPDEFFAFHGERTSRQIKVTCVGDPGHGSFLSSGTAGEKIAYIIDKFMSYRAEQTKQIKSRTIRGFGEITTINLTQLEGGVQINVLPKSLSASFDIRIAPHVDHDKFEEMIDTWCKEAGKGVTYEYFVKNPQVPNSQIEGNPFYTALADTVKDLGITMKSSICPGATDARFVRLQGIPAINITPIRNTPLLIHNHDERLNIEEYKRGIDVMEKIVLAVANVGIRHTNHKGDSPMRESAKL
ncbi:aminoacylase-1-like [Pectinophora gossypiella]|uniref:aminoacylase-1-like n=1 Tax=Pectinophora gossypiella TaxID=13191 RepID=UPI00214EA3F7|nr:aminoacylase-1-like [Pectinophora gossypiella]